MTAGADASGSSYSSYSAVIAQGCDAQEQVIATVSCTHLIRTRVNLTDNVLLFHECAVCLSPDGTPGKTLVMHCSFLAAHRLVLTATPSLTIYLPAYIYVYGLYIEARCDHRNFTISTGENGAVLWYLLTSSYEEQAGADDHPVVTSEVEYANGAAFKSCCTRGRCPRQCRTLCGIRVARFIKSTT